MKALRVQWNAKMDMFTFNLSTPQDVVYTKRRFLKKLALLSDPFQIVVPFTIRARMAMQETWLLGLGWDDQFPRDLKKACQEWWRKVTSELFWSPTLMTNAIFLIIKQKIQSHF